MHAPKLAGIMHRPLPAMPTLPKWLRWHLVVAILTTNAITATIVGYANRPATPSASAALVTADENSVDRPCFVQHQLGEGQTDAHSVAGYRGGFWVIKAKPGFQPKLDYISYCEVAALHFGKELAVEDKRAAIRRKAIFDVRFALRNIDEGMAKNPALSENAQATTYASIQDAGNILLPEDNPRLFAEIKAKNAKLRTITPRAPQDIPQDIGSLLRQAAKNFRQKSTR